MGGYALCAVSRVDRESDRGEKILTLPLRTRISTSGSGTSMDAILKYAFQFSPFPIELAACLK